MKPVSIGVMVVCSVMLWLIYAAASVKKTGGEEAMDTKAARQAV